MNAPMARGPRAFRGREFALEETAADDVGGDWEIVETSAPWGHNRPAFVANLSGGPITDWIVERMETPASYLCRHQDVLLFAQNSVLDTDGRWSCESIQFRTQFMDSFLSAAYRHAFSGPKPGIRVVDGTHRLSIDALRDDEIETIDEPVFLATPLEPDNWGRWIATVVPKVFLFRKYGEGRKFFCRAHMPWQRALLAELGLTADQVLDHAPGRTYFCRDVMTTRLSATSMIVSAGLRRIYGQVCQEMGAARPRPERRLFVSRLSRSRRNPHYRALMDEPALIGALQAHGFESFEPEQHSFCEQVRIFAGATAVACLGGAGLYNVAFCQPGTRVVTLESSDTFIRPHCRFVASMGFDYGVVFGRQDPDDTAPVHRRWQMEVGPATEAIAAFCSAPAG